MFTNWCSSTFFAPSKHQYFCFTFTRFVSRVVSSFIKWKVLSILGSSTISFWSFKIRNNYNKWEQLKKKIKQHMDWLRQNGIYWAEICDVLCTVQTSKNYARSSLKIKLFGVVRLKVVNEQSVLEKQILWIVPFDLIQINWIYAT